MDTFCILNLHSGLRQVFNGTSALPIGIDWTHQAILVTWVFGGLAISAFLAFTVWLVVKSTRYPLGFRVGFWWNLSDVYCRWWFRLRREGPCTVPAEGPVIVVANHTCGMDPLLIVSSMPHRLPAFMVAREYHELPLGGRLTRMLECIPVRRDGQDTSATRAALRHLKQGKVLAIFIEGRIARPGETLEAKDGAAMLALHSRAIVVPVHISGTHWNEYVLWSFLRRHRARVRYGPPIDLSEWTGPRPDKERVAQISAMLLGRIRELGRKNDPQC